MARERNLKAEAVWRHNSLLGQITFGLRAAQAVQSTPTTSKAAKELAAEMEKIAMLILIDLRNNRIDNQ